jgi:hypothetical protein
VLAAVKLSALVLLVFAGLKIAVTPAGSPAIPSEALLVAPLRPVTEMLLLALEPVYSVKLLGEGARASVGTGMMSEKLVELLALPEVPVTVTV